jgi:hypothetical protein
MSLTPNTNFNKDDPNVVRALSIGAPTAGGGSAPVGAQYLVLASDATLTAERVLTAGTGISFVDTGANGTLTINAGATGDTVMTWMNM